MLLILGQLFKVVLRARCSRDESLAIVTETAPAAA
jgi:hypothetical protein